MAVELTAVLPQTVQYGQNVLFTETPIPCRKGYVVHREGAGIVTLRGVGCQCRARYRIDFGANIAVPTTGGTVGPISLALAIDGETLPSTIMTVTPGATGGFFSTSRSTFVDVPCGCCVTIAIENVSTTDTGAGVPVDVANANLIIERVA